MIEIDQVHPVLNNYRSFHKLKDKPEGNSNWAKLESTPCGITLELDHAHIVRPWAIIRSLTRSTLNRRHRDATIFRRSSIVDSSFRFERFSWISGLIRGLVQWLVEVYRWWKLRIEVFWKNNWLCSLRCSKGFSLCGWFNVLFMGMVRCDCGHVNFGEVEVKMVKFWSILFLSSKEEEFQRRLYVEIWGIK